MTFDGLIVDNFAGGGGASSGLEAAYGRPVDIAINHCAEALAMHKANHPETEHIRQNIWQVDPDDIRRRGPVAVAWFSPDCTHHSKAKGGRPIRTPQQRSSRDLAWVVVNWAKRAKPLVIFLENVEEFEGWSPVYEEGKAKPEEKGITFRRWVKALRAEGYKVEWRQLRACDYGAPTIRKRLFLIARRDGLPIVWPEPTHGPGRPLPYRTAADIIDWSIPCPSIFLTKEEAAAYYRDTGQRIKRPLAEATMARIARGVKRYVLDSSEPFIVSVAHGDSGGRREYGLDEPHGTVTSGGQDRALVVPSIAHLQHGGANRAADDPLHTVTASNKDCNLLVAPTLVQTGYGEREGQAPRSLDIEAPLGTVVAGGVKHALIAPFVSRQFGASTGSGPADPLGTVTAGGGGKSAVVAAFIAKHYGGMVGCPVTAPAPTTTTRGTQNQLVAAHLLNLKGSDRRDRDMRDPTFTVTAGGGHAAAVYAFLMKYYGTDQDPRLGEPLHTITTKDRFGLVTVPALGPDWIIADIGMRMLSARELFRAQGFRDDYIIDPEFNGKPLTKTGQVSCCGNSVSPVVAEALARANPPAIPEIQSHTDSAHHMEI